MEITAIWGECLWNNKDPPEIFAMLGTGMPWCTGDGRHSLAHRRRHPSPWTNGTHLLEGRLVHS